MLAGDARLAFALPTLVALTINGACGVALAGGAVSLAGTAPVVPQTFLAMDALRVANTIDAVAAVAGTII